MYSKIKFILLLSFLLVLNLSFDGVSKAPKSKKVDITCYTYFTVKDKYGNALPGVNIVKVGTRTGTVTDADGKATLPYTPGGSNDYLIFMVGFKSVTVTREVACYQTFFVMLEDDVDGSMDNSWIENSYYDL